jgi:hypothetical protein
LTESDWRTSDRSARRAVRRPPRRRMVSKARPIDGHKVD